MTKGGAAGLLSLVAAPLFAVMALVTLAVGDGHGALLCTQAGLPSVLSGMAPMYLLMAVVHLPPWLKMAARD